MLNLAVSQCTTTVTYLQYRKTKAATFTTGKILQPFQSLSTSVNGLSKLTTFGIHDVRYRSLPKLNPIFSEIYLFTQYLFNTHPSLTSFSIIVLRNRQTEVNRQGKGAENYNK